MKTAFGQYQLVSELGRGGMGVVFKARDAALDRFVAIKVLGEGLAHDARVVERFQREARAVAALDDAHVVHIYAIGSENGLPYFAMEFVDGVSLDALLKREKHLAPDQAARLVVQAARGLACAHARGLIHRDVKPGNILISTAGIVKVSDFGIARSTRDGASRLTTTGAFLGTPGYLAPERYDDGAVADARADIFALGIVLFECLAGHLPYKSTSPLALMREVAQTPLPDIRAINPDVDAELARILERMTAKEPAQRYAECRELIDDLMRHFAIGADEALTVHVRHSPELPLLDVPTGTSTQRLRTPFLQRLKNRWIVQWALAYLAGAFALLQVLDIVGQQFGWAEGVRRGITVALAIGFCVALVLAWYHGERGAQRVTGTELLILTLLLAVGGGLLWRVAPAPDDAVASAVAEAPIPDKSIAVLPLKNASDDRHAQYFSDGLTESLIGELTQCAGLKVISRDSSFQFRAAQRDSRSIGRALGVAHLLEGSVQRSGDEVRVSVVLVDAADGRTAWAQNYDRGYRDLFALQDEIAAEIAAQLRIRMRLDSAAAGQGERPPSGSLDAYDAWLQGKFYLNLQTEAGLREAIVRYSRAIGFDARYAQAYASRSLAWSLLAQGYLGGDAAADAYASARTDARQAQALAPNLVDSHLALGAAALLGDMNMGAAEAEFRSAVRLALPEAAAGPKQHLAEVLAQLGHFDEAVDLLHDALRLNPLSVGAWQNLGEYELARGRVDAAERAIRKAIELRPDAAFNYTDLAVIDIVRGDAVSALANAQRETEGGWRAVAVTLALQIGTDRAAADAALRDLVAGHADTFAFQIAEVYALRRDADEAFKWLERARAARDPGVLELLIDPFFNGLRGDPRFAVFCRNVGLPVPGRDAPAGS